MADAKRFQSFEEFWPFYVKEHSKETTRVLHFVGTTAALGCVASAVVLRKPLLLLAAPVLGYGPAWFSHFFIEKNRPATFTYPAWSLRADLVMWKKMVMGEMDGEVERILAEERAAEASPESPESPERDQVAAPAASSAQPAVN